MRSVAIDIVLEENDPILCTLVCETGTYRGTISEIVVGKSYFSKLFVDMWDWEIVTRKIIEL